MNILLVGAYERDNFGDLLFLDVIRHYAKNHNIVASSFIESDMTEINGELVYPYTLLLEKFSWDAIWVAGGEVGGVNALSAIGMSLDRVLLKSYSQSKVLASVILDAFFAGRQYAYLPSKNKYKHNADALYLVTSAGGLYATMKNQGKPEHESPFNIKEKKSYLCVRDKKSHDALKELGAINLDLKPDIVHVISKIYEVEKLSTKPYILVQISEKILSEVDSSAFIEAIYDYARENNLDIKFFAAGLANGHDSLESYEKLKYKINDKTIKVTIENVRNPRDIVSLIANSGVVVASSLHARIVASSYSVPRVSLSKNKVNEYAQQWDNLYPFDVSLNEITNALGAAFALSDKNSKHKSSQLIELADGCLKEALKWLESEAPEASTDITQEKILETMFRENIIVKKRLLANFSEVLNDLENRETIISSLSKENEDISSQLHRIQDWPTVRFERKARKFVGKMKRRLTKS